MALHGGAQTGCPELLVGPGVEGMEDAVEIAHERQIARGASTGCRAPRWSLASFGRVIDQDALEHFIQVEAFTRRMAEVPLQLAGHHIDPPPPIKAALTLSRRDLT